MRSVIQQKCDKMTIELNQYLHFSVSFAVAIAIHAEAIAQAPDKKTIASTDESLKLREVALTSHRANFAMLKGVQCDVKCVMTLDQDRLQTTEQPPPGVAVVAIPESKDVVPSGKRSVETASEHVVVFCGERVRNERRSNGRITDVIVRDGEFWDRLSFEPSPRLERRKTSDPLATNGMIIDPRDFGEIVGMGALDGVLETWNPTFAAEDVTKYGATGLVELQLQEPVAESVYG